MDDELPKIHGNKRKQGDKRSKPDSPQTPSGEEPHEWEDEEDCGNSEYFIKDSIWTASICESKTENKEQPTNLYHENSKIRQKWPMCKNLKLETM